MGLLLGSSLIKRFVSAGVVTISGIASVNENGAGTRSVRLWFGVDGIIQLYRTSTGYVQVNASTDWIIPNGAADSSYDVRMASIGVGNWNTTPAGTGVWINLGSAREWRITDTDPSALNFEQVGNMVFEIRKDGGSPLASTTLPTSGNWIANRTS